MKYLSLSLLVLCLFWQACTCSGDCQKNTKMESLKAMTYNLRLDIAIDGENAWTYRKASVGDQVKFFAPDVLGVQEARPNQMQDLKATLSNYRSIGNGRDGGDKGEHTAIFYNADKLSVERDSTFWLSETPSELSKGWDAAYPRICTYGLFTVLDTDQKFWVFNTHLDHKGAQAQLEGIKMVLNAIKEVETPETPAVLMGDFNVTPDSEVIQTVKKQMNDSKEIAAVTFGSDGTFNGFNVTDTVTRRIDYVLFSKNDAIELQRYGVFSSVIDQRFLSDHFPVFTEFLLKK